MEQKYRFATLDIPSAIIMQHTIEMRKIEITAENSPEMKLPEKTFKALIAELDLMYCDLDHHIASLTRLAAYKKAGAETEARDNGLSG